MHMMGDKMGSTAKVHLLFRGASEVTKVFRTGALVCDFAAAGVSLYAILGKPQDLSAWLPLTIVGLAVVSTGLRAYSSAAHGFAQRCRRISLRAFCAGEEVDQVSLVLLDDDAPMFVGWAAKLLPAKSMEQYYEPMTPPGELREAELYAHSAFYTWRLIRTQAWITFALAAIVFVVCCVLIYHLAAMTQTTVDRRAVLEAISTVVLLSISVKGLEAAWEAYSSYREIRSIENELLRIPTGEALQDLVDSYDIERAAGSTPSTLIYCLCRNGLASKWNERRKSFDNPSSKTP